jgi:site-specific recombinase XerD
VSQHTLPNAHNYQGGLTNSPNIYRATGITTFLENGGDLETAWHIAGHASANTTRIYDHRNQKVAREETERVRI